MYKIDYAQIAIASCNNFQNSNNNNSIIIQWRKRKRPAFIYGPIDFEGQMVYTYFVIVAFKWCRYRYFGKNKSGGQYHVKNSYWKMGGCR